MDGENVAARELILALTLVPFELLLQVGLSVGGLR
jgi:hypothetical protein